MNVFEELTITGEGIANSKASLVTRYIQIKDLKDYLLGLKDKIDHVSKNENFMEKIFGCTPTTGQALAVMKFIEFLTKE